MRGHSDSLSHIIPPLPWPPLRRHLPSTSLAPGLFHLTAWGLSHCHLGGRPVPSIGALLDRLHSSFSLPSQTCLGVLVTLLVLSGSAAPLLPASCFDLWHTPPPGVLVPAMGCLWGPADLCPGKRKGQARQGRSGCCLPCPDGHVETRTTWHPWRQAGLPGRVILECGAGQAQPAAWAAASFLQGCLWALGE